MRRIAKVIASVLLVMAAGLALAWVTSPDPRGNPASFEDTPLNSRIAPLAEAITLASYRSIDGTPATLIVVDSDGERVFGVDLTALGADRTGDPLRDLASVDRAALTAQALASKPLVTLGLSDLLPSAPGGYRHIGVGTNFPEHAEEANSGSVFVFPKFASATPARTRIRARPGILLDYEVELCMRFDRDIATLQDFDAAVKGIFLCGDFTNRNALVELADPDNLDSGYGFSDAKSGEGSFPTGPFILVPRDWQQMVGDLRMTTSVNGDPRQDARAREMTLDFRGLAEKALGDMEEPRFLYDGGFVKLSDDRRISREATLMSGTSEGVIFAPPTRADIIEGMVIYCLSGGPLSGAGLVETIKQRFIANELESAHFLQPGDIVRHDSNVLGSIEVIVVNEAGDQANSRRAL